VIDVSEEEESYGRIFVQFLPQIGALRKRGLAGWAILSGGVIVGLLGIMTLIAPWISPYSPIAINVGPLLSPPSAQYPLGTNHLGQDMLSRVYYGGAIMFQVSILSVIVCLLVGVPIGLFASYKGGFTDKVASLVMDSIYAFPGLVLAIAIAAMLGPGVVNMALSIAVVYVPSYFRIIRSQVLTIKELPYVDAARMMGAKTKTTLLSYVLPNVIPSIVSVATINFADAILTAAGLTFVGLGLSVSTPDWGWDLTYGRRLLTSGAWWVITFPGVMVVLLALGFTLLGEGLSELFNPRLER
jgi:peptide/nickel transport system permease protein